MSFRANEGRGTRGTRPKPRRGKSLVVAIAGVFSVLCPSMAEAGGAITTPLSPPASITADCSVDVSRPMQHWLHGLPASATVQLPSNACYLVNEGIALSGVNGLTISGGTWEDEATPVGGDVHALSPIFWFVGGSGITLTNMRLEGANSGGYDPSGAFAAAVRSDGVTGLNVSSLAINGVYGDGIELNALRANGDIGSTILNPTQDVSINGVTISGAGRQGITLADVTGAVISSVSMTHIGINAFDFEADQWNEGARNVTINGCRTGAGQGGLFFANGGAGAGAPWTKDVTVENCTMQAAAAGDAILVQDIGGPGALRGPFTFASDTLLCGASAYVSCVETNGADVSISGSTLIFPGGTVHEPVYHSTNGSTVTFSGDSVIGFGTLGAADRSSSVSVSGGRWTPWAGTTRKAGVGSTTPGAPLDDVVTSTDGAVGSPQVSTPGVPSAHGTGSAATMRQPDRSTSHPGPVSNLSSSTRNDQLVLAAEVRRRLFSAPFAAMIVIALFCVGLLCRRRRLLRTPAIYIPSQVLLGSHGELQHDGPP